jgi:hypothetical protein
MRKGWLLLLCLLTACSGSKMLDNTTAEETIKKLLDKQYYVYSRVGRIGTDCGTETIEGIQVNSGSKPDLSEMSSKAMGYITIEPDGANYWKITLTEQGKAAARREPYGGTVKNGCDFKQVEFPVANPEFMKIAGITADENNPEVEYLWRWKVTKLGEALRQDGAVYITLTPEQRSKMQKLEIMGGSLGDVPIPIPPEDTVVTSVVKFKRYTDGWRMQ